MPRWLAEGLAAYFAGEGPARESWERHAQMLTGQKSGISIEFVGWLQKDALMTRSRSTAAVVAQYILELAEPRPASGAREGAVGVIPNGALEPQPGSS